LLTAGECLVGFLGCEEGVVPVVVKNIRHGGWRRCR
jgi:hypothetical protein